MQKMHGDSLNGLEPSGMGIQAALPLPPASRMERMPKVDTTLTLHAASQERREQSCPSLQQSGSSTRTPFFSPPQAGAHIRYFFPSPVSLPSAESLLRRVSALGTRSGKPTAGLRRDKSGQTQIARAQLQLLFPVGRELAEVSCFFFFYYFFSSFQPATSHELLTHHVMQAAAGWLDAMSPAYHSALGSGKAPLHSRAQLLSFPSQALSDLGTGR